MASPPPHRICAAKDCDGATRYRIDGIGWCNKHGRRVRHNGSPDVVRRTASYAGRECSVNGCAGRPRRNGMCAPHSEQFRTWGDPLMRTTKAPDGAGSVRKDGYRMLTMHGHPLADHHGHVLEHRVVLFAKIGPNDHPCHWCRCMLRWNAQGTTGRIEADHLDFDPGNNDPGNLVPSCNPCNVRRNLERRWASSASTAMACQCGHAWRSRARLGHWIRCPACRTLSKVQAPH